MNLTSSPNVTLEEGEINVDGIHPLPTYNCNCNCNSNCAKKKSPSKICSRCIFSCCCFSALLTLSLSLIVFYFYLYNRPQVPIYKVDNFEVKAFDWQPDFTLKAEFLLTLRADNPNSHVGIMYGEDSSVSVVFADVDLCSGKLPHFYQGEKNVSLMRVDLVGFSKFGSGLQKAYAKSRKNGKIPLLVKVKVPVRVVVGQFPLREFNVFVNYSLVVDNLSPNKKIKIVSTNTTFDYEF